LSQDDYRDLLAFRTALRRFEGWSEAQARAVGLTPAQHQLLLSVRGHDDERGPTVTEIAEYLNVRHHSAVGLIDRTARAGYVRRGRDTEDGRIVRVALTAEGAQRVAALSELHIHELARLTPLLDHLREPGSVDATPEPAGRRVSP
jgi:DNA-binding MarR family transcriptional regulator